MNSLSHDFTILSKWFYNNFMVLNPDKCSFMLLGVDIIINKLTWCVVLKLLKTVKKEKVLGATTDNKLNFETHLSNITKNVNIKFNALARVQKYMTTDKKKVYSLLLLNLTSLIALYYGSFAQNILLVELPAYMNDACVSFKKSAPLISKYFLRIQMQNQSTKNAKNSLWLRFINT